MLPFLKHKPIIGLDIRSDEIRLLQLKKIKNGITIEKFGRVPLPAGAVAGEGIKDCKKVSASLEQLIQMTGTTGYPVAIALPANSVMSRRIKLSVHLKPDQYEKEILSKLDYYLPGVEKPLCFDFVDGFSHDGEYRDVWLIAAGRDQVQKYVEVINQAGLTVKAVDTDFFALARGVRHHYPQREDAIGILDVDVHTVQWVVSHHEEVLFTHHFLLEELENQLQPVLQLFHSMHREIKLHSIILTGKKDFFPVISQLVSSEYELIPFDSFVPIKTAANVNAQDFKNAVTRMTLCLGLALRNRSAW